MGKVLETCIITRALPIDVGGLNAGVNMTLHGAISLKFTVFLIVNYYFNYSSISVVETTTSLALDHLSYIFVSSLQGLPSTIEIVITKHLNGYLMVTPNGVRHNILNFFFFFRDG